MTDLHDRLAALRVTSAPTDEPTLAADLRRGRRAAARRRSVRIATTSAFALGIGGVTTAVVVTGSHSDAPAGGVRLVDYTGAQQPGFTVDEIPAGYVLQGVQAGTLDVALPGDTSSLDDFRDKIVVTVEQASPPPASGPQWSYRERVRVSRHHGGTLHYRCPNGSTGVIRVTGQRLIHDPCPGSSTTSAPDTVGTTIDVDGSAGTISRNGEGATYFRYTSGDVRVVIQVWPTFGLTDAQLREFADGITVTPDAQLSHG
ncbi:hypothetical protein GCM10028801_34770 [Nocardioides maradonensis]